MFLSVLCAALHFFHSARDTSEAMMPSIMDNKKKGNKDDFREMFHCYVPFSPTV